MLWDVFIAHVGGKNISLLSAVHLLCVLNSQSLWLVSEFVLTVIFQVFECVHSQSHLLITCFSLQV